LLGHLAFLCVPTSEYHLGCAETDKVPGCLESETRVGTRDDDSLAGEIITWDRQLDELALEKAHGVAVGHVVSK
jgi:hypothetical protein